ncbi:hypothetical protein A3715_18155 [Oleiphilus sp. HI0009]|nr:hypothetical protein A3715_18155 [Oleiphilus sp. HI0009]
MVSEVIRSLDFARHQCSTDASKFPDSAWEIDVLSDRISQLTLNANVTDLAELFIRQYGNTGTKNLLEDQLADLPSDIKKSLLPAVWDSYQYEINFNWDLYFKTDSGFEKDWVF